MYSNNYINKPSFMTSTTTSGFGGSFTPTTSSFGQPTNNPPMFSSIPMQQPSLFTNNQPSTSSFSGGSNMNFGTNLFGQAQPQPSTSGLFGSNNSFGQNKSFGFGATTTTGSNLFGQPVQQPQAGSSMFQSNSTNLFGSNAFGNQQTTGTVIKFSPVTGSDTMQKSGVTSSINTKHHCITCMKEYENKSFEELRFEDYSCNRKGPQQQSGFQNNQFASPSTPAANPIFGQTDAHKIQTPGFGQTSTFGPSSLNFGSNNQSTMPALFGKTSFNPMTSSTSTFGASTSANPFSSSQVTKSFTQPLFGSGTSTIQSQSTFGQGTSGMFGQTATQNTMPNLFQKPAQPTTGFNTGQQSFSFTQPTTTQATSSFFPAANKTTTGFGLFGQPPTTSAFGQPTQTSFGNNFGKLNTTFPQTTQPAFGATLGGGLTQQPIFGNTGAKPPTLFSNTGLQTNNMFQQPQNTFNLSTGLQPSTSNFVTEQSDNSKNIALLITDLYPDGPHLYGLEPCILSPTKINKAAIVSPVNLRKNEEPLGASTKLKVLPPRNKSYVSLKEEFFETNKILLKSPKCLVIRKQSEEGDKSVFHKYSNAIVEEVEKSLQTTPFESTEGSLESSTLSTPREVKEHVRRLKIDNIEEGIKIPKTLDFETSEITGHRSLPELNTSRISIASECGTHVVGAHGDGLNEEIDVDNPASVILTKVGYYMYPQKKDLGEYINERNQCIVPNLTIGRKGFGNVYFPDPINVMNLNIDDCVHFRHREIIVYPDEANKPPVGEGLNRTAQVTLDKVFPKREGTNQMVTDVEEIQNSNFLDNLLLVTQRHNCTFVDYRPETGSWVFKVKHFSKYSFSASDEEQSLIPKDAVSEQKKKLETIQEKPGKENVRTSELHGKVSGDTPPSYSKKTSGYHEGSRIEPEQMGWNSIESTTFSPLTKPVLHEIQPAENVIETMFVSEHITFHKNGPSQQTKTIIEPEEIFSYSTNVAPPSNFMETMEEQEQILELEDRLNMSETYPKDLTSSAYFMKSMLQDEEMQEPKQSLFKTSGFAKEERPHWAQDTVKSSGKPGQQFKSAFLSRFKQLDDYNKLMIIEAPQPIVYKLPNTLDPDFLAICDAKMKSRRCCADLGIFQDKRSRAGWDRGFKFYSLTSSGYVTAPILAAYSLNSGQAPSIRNTPTLDSILSIALQEIMFKDDSNGIPTVYIDNGASFLRKLTKLFLHDAKQKGLEGLELYNCSVWELCTALFKDNTEGPTLRGGALHDWLRKYTSTFLQEESKEPGNSTEAFESIFELLTCGNIRGACELARKHKLLQLSLLLSQLPSNRNLRVTLQRELENLSWKEPGVVDDNYKKIYLLLCGLQDKDNIHVCEDLDWLRCFALHYWYIGPGTSSIRVPFEVYKKAADENLPIGDKRKPFYCTREISKHKDLLYHILQLAINRNTQLCNVLDPGTYTADVLDYRMSWLLAQILISLNIGLMETNEREYLHISFSSQLEELGEWKWAIFVLLFLQNNLQKKALISRILERNLPCYGNEIQNELISTFRIPEEWLTEVEAVKVKNAF